MPGFGSEGMVLSSHGAVVLPGAGLDRGAYSYDNDGKFGG